MSKLLVIGSDLEQRMVSFDEADVLGAVTGNLMLQEYFAEKAVGRMTAQEKISAEQIVYVTVGLAGGIGYGYECEKRPYELVAIVFYRKD